MNDKIARNAAYGKMDVVSAYPDAALFDIEPTETTPAIPHYWHETFQSYGEASARDSLPNLYVIVRITHTMDGYHREAFGIAATEAEAAQIVDRFRPLEPGSQWDIDEYTALPF